MLNRVFTKTYTLGEIDEREVLRYAGHKGEENTGVKETLQACIRASENAFSCRVCYTAISLDGLPSGWKNSTLVKNRLQNASYVVLFAATVGLEIDRLILKEESVSPVKALLLQSLGAERIESLCEQFCQEIKTECEKQGYFTTARFSAGYGDFPLEEQKTLFDLLRPEKHIGLTLNSSLLMSPSKSVTAIIPIGKIDCQ